MSFSFPSLNKLNHPYAECVTALCLCNGFVCQIQALAINNHPLNSCQILINVHAPVNRQLLSYLSVSGDFFIEMSEE